MQFFSTTSFNLLAEFWFTYAENGSIWVGWLTCIKMNKLLLPICNSSRHCSNPGYVHNSKCSIQGPAYGESWTQVSTKEGVTDIWSVHEALLSYWQIILDHYKIELFQFFLKSFLHQNLLTITQLTRKSALSTSLLKLFIKFSYVFVYFCFSLLHK